MRSVERGAASVPAEEHFFKDFSPEDQALKDRLGSLGIFCSDFIEPALSLEVFQEDTKAVDLLLKIQDRLILDRLWGGLAIGLITEKDIQEYTGKSLFGLELLFLSEQPGSVVCLFCHPGNEKLN